MSTTTKIESFTGNVRRNHLGQIVIDTCESDGAHLRREGPLPEGWDRWRCRRLVEDAFQDMVGKRGTLVLRVEFFEDREDPYDDGGNYQGEPPNAPL